MNKNITRTMIISCKILLIVLPFYIFLPWAYIDTVFMKKLIQGGYFFNPTYTPAGIVFYDAINWTTSTQLLGMISTLLGSVADMMCLWILLKIFKNYQNHSIFTVENAKNYRKIGFSFLLQGLVLTPLSDTFLTLALTLGNQPGNRFVTLGYGTPSMRPLFLSGVVILVSWVMIEASKIQSEQELTV